MAVPKGWVHAKPTLCWNCRNAVPDREGTRGCSWSRDFIPVEGWDATPQKLAVYYGKSRKSRMRLGDSFIVQSCPKFEEG